MAYTGHTPREIGVLFWREMVYEIVDHHDIESCFAEIVHQRIADFMLHARAEPLLLRDFARAVHRAR